MKFFLAVIVTLLIGSCVARIEYDRWSNFEPVMAQLQSATVTCWGGGNSQNYIDCADAKPHADRRTEMRLTYVSPADHAEHHGRIRCGTEWSQTTSYVDGQIVEVLAHRRDPNRIDKPRCTAVSDPS